MAKFKNIVTGNLLETNDPLTIKLMQKSDRYEALDAPDVEAVPAKKNAKAKAAAVAEDD